MNKVLEILNEIRPECDFKKSDDFFEDDLLDSMDIIELVNRMEESFGIEFDMMDMVPENFCNIDAINKLIGKYGKR